MNGMTRVFPMAMALAIVASACASSTEAPTPIPITLAPPEKVDNYSGTLHVGGSNYHQFGFKESGIVQITLTSVAYANITDADGNSVPNPRTDPIPGLTILVGTPAATTIGLQCSPIAFNGAVQFAVATPGTAPQLSGNALAGQYCISVSDPSIALLDPVVYKISIAHPLDPAS